MDHAETCKQLTGKKSRERLRHDPPQAAGRAEASDTSLKTYQNICGRGNRLEKLDKSLSEYLIIISTVREASSHWVFVPLDATLSKKKNNNNKKVFFNKLKYSF